MLGQASNRARKMVDKHKSTELCHLPQGTPNLRGHFQSIKVTYVKEATHGNSNPHLTRQTQSSLVLECLFLDASQTCILKQKSNNKYRLLIIRLLSFFIKNCFVSWYYIWFTLIIINILVALKTYVTK